LSLWRHGGDAETRARGRGGTARQGMERRNGGGGASCVRGRFSTDQRHARLGRLSYAGCEKPAATFPRRDQWHRQAVHREAVRGGVIAVRSTSALHVAPLCPAGHLPRKGGDQPPARFSPIIGAARGAASV